MNEKTEDVAKPVVSGRNPRKHVVARRVEMRRVGLLGVARLARVEQDGRLRMQGHRRDYACFSPLRATSGRNKSPDAKEPAQFKRPRVGSETTAAGTIKTVRQL